MLQLIEINEETWMDVRRLSVREDQAGYLDSAVGILARGYAYRSARARVIGIAAGGTVIGAALVKDLDEEPACYDLQQFFIDRRYQGQGWGTAALKQILSELAKERKYDWVEVCVKQDDAAALRVYEKVGFVDTGYVDEDAPDSRNLMYRFPAASAEYTDILISDFTDPRFRAAFRAYFSELGIPVEDWTGLFREMNEEGDNRAYVRCEKDGGTVGFIQFKPIQFSSWFFEETCGFIREFWVSKTCRGAGHGAALLKLAEDWFLDRGIRTSILTTDTAEGFYLKHGYRKAPGCRAKNGDAVFVKRL